MTDKMSGDQTKDTNSEEKRCDDCTFGCCCAEHGYTSHSPDRYSELKGGVGVPLGHYPFPFGSEDAKQWLYPKN